MNNKLALVGHVNNGVGAFNNVLKSIKKRDYSSAVAHAMMVAKSAVDAIEAYHKLEVEVTREISRE